MGHAHIGRADRHLALAILLNLALAGGEVAAGLVSGSLALLSDAAHNAGDVAGLAITYAARRLGRRPPSHRFTYGFRRMEIFAALANGGFLLVVNTLIFREAFNRLASPTEIHAPLMAAVGSLAILVNGVGVALLFKDSKEDINLKAAFLHLLQDTLASVVVVLAAACVHFGVGSWVDPVASLLVGAIVLRSAFGIVRESLGILLEGAPPHLSLAEVEGAVHGRFPGTVLHHAHLWSVGPGETAFTGHLRLPEMALAEAQALSIEVRAFLGERFGISHATLECECGECDSAELLCNGRNSHQ